METFNIVNVFTGVSCGKTSFCINPAPEKKRRLNAKCENMYLLPDGTIKREEDSIRFLQRFWRERVYAPVTGCMYKKTEENWKKNLTNTIDEHRISRTGESAP